jgi:hypothetical protein
VTAAALAAIAITVSPARVNLLGNGTAIVRVANTGNTTAVMDASRAGFALDLRGRPRIVTAASSVWLSFSPSRLWIAPGRAGSLKVTAHAGRGMTPGDHAAVLLLTQHPVARGGVAVRTRIGVLVVLRVPGAVVHRLTVTGIRALARRRLAVSLRNRGNVAELLQPGRLTVTLWRGRRVVARLHPTTRELLPRTRGLIELRYRGLVSGRLTARVVLATTGQAPFRRAFTLKV